MTPSEATNACFLTIRPPTSAPFLPPFASEPARQTPQTKTAFPPVTKSLAFLCKQPAISFKKKKTAERGLEIMTYPRGADSGYPAILKFPSALRLVPAHCKKKFSPGPYKIFCRVAALALGESGARINFEARQKKLALPPICYAHA